MKILLVGEYSRLHNSLKEGLIALGHEVTIVGSGDCFKNFPVDYSIAAKTISSFFLFRFANKLSLKLLKINLEDIERGFRFKKLLPKLKNYDVVQLINSDAIETFPVFSIYLLKKLFHQNKKIFLLICGDETPIIDFLLQKKLKYSILSPLFKNSKLKNYYQYTLKYTSKKYRKLYDFVLLNCDGILVSDLDYKIPMEQTKTQFFFIANPINIDTIKYLENPILDKINIFHGVNNSSSVKKGNDYFEKALEIIQNKYPEKVEIINTQNIPYDVYINSYNKSHILLDQVFSFDQGYNALEAMAKGKVVFTGAETEFMKHYNLKDKVCINALPDLNYLIRELVYLIENPNEIIAIGKRARVFIEQSHNYIKVATKYLEIWNNKG